MRCFQRTDGGVQVISGASAEAPRPGGRAGEPHRGGGYNEILKMCPRRLNKVGEGLNLSLGWGFESPRAGKRRDANETLDSCEDSQSNARLLTRPRQPELTRLATVLTAAIW